MQGKDFNMVSQMRLFSIQPGHLDDFVRAWQAGVYPLRLRSGYTIDCAWAIPERHEFIWILSYDGPEDWAAKEAAYYASPERAAVDPDPRQYIVQTQAWFVTPSRPAASPLMGS